LEHHKETNVVAIDIGTHVNVRVGHEFKVFHPDFVGGKDFVISDGRSNRCLGEYPRMDYGLIEVFVVQPEISFCKVLSSTVGGFLAGSHLSSVPRGEFAHLLPSEERSALERPYDLQI